MNAIFFVSCEKKIMGFRETPEKLENYKKTIRITLLFLIVQKWL